VLGGWLGSTLLGWSTVEFDLRGFAVAVGGAVLLLIVYRLATGGVRSVR
jgi:uncharacterized membrane protein YeaQ/YmgE (transglycosylase-associated protein family)